MQEFFNPYAHVPSGRHDRLTFPDGPPAQPLGRLHPECWTGRLRVSMVTRTPLLLTHVTDVIPNGHRTRETIRVPGSTDRADLLATSFKGMLRAAYEAATESRFGVFASGARLTTRMSAREAQRLRLLPCRVQSRNDGCVTLQILPGEALAQAAAWVPCYFGCPGPGPHRGCCPNIDARNIEHGDPVDALVTQCVRPAKGRQPPIPYWRVLDITRAGQRLDGSLARSRLAHYLGRRTGDARQAVLRRVTGWYACTGQNTENKRYERLFFYGFADQADAPRAAPMVTLDPQRVDDRRVIEDWQELIRDYRERHRNALNPVTVDGRTYGPGDYITGNGRRRARPAYSRHILDAVQRDDPPDTLPPGTLCYAQLDHDPGATSLHPQVKALFPVAIARRMSENSPAELAEYQRLSAVRRREDASMADRVFGWAGESSRRGRVRIERCTHRPSTPGIAPVGLEEGIPLAVLSAPKPQQHLFYIGGQNGSPLRSDQRPYSPGTGLRGRKVYPAAAQLGVYQRGERDGQNASLLDWVPDGAVFDIDIVVEDLTLEELGALSWLLQSDHRHRLGLGKPLGFGTVSITIDSAHSMLRSGEQWADRFRLLGQSPEDNDLPVLLAKASSAFLAAVEMAWNEEEPPFLRALTRVLKGFPSHVPVQYPADPRNPQSGTEQFRWFKDNQEARLPLGDLAEAPTGSDSWWESMLLPVNPSAAATPSGPRGQRDRDGRKPAVRGPNSPRAQADPREPGSAGTPGAARAPDRRGSGGARPDRRDIGRGNRPSTGRGGGQDER
jgi:CRISPR-associated protein (TIGR03986 family)